MIVLAMLSCLLLEALWSHAGKGLTSWLSFVLCSFVLCFLVFLSLFNMVSRPGVVLDCSDSYSLFSSLPL